MNQTPTVEQFLAEQSTEDDDFLEEALSDPLASIADSLRQLTEIVVRRDGVDAAEEAQDQEAEQLRQGLADLEDKHRSLFELLAEVEKIVKPSTSKVSLEVKAAIEAWKNPAVENASESGLKQPAHDAPVEEWRTYARLLGHGRTGPAFNELEAMNRSQIRTMLDIEQPGGE